jgi:hypothetical protein
MSVTPDKARSTVATRRATNGPQQVSEMRSRAGTSDLVPTHEGISAFRELMFPSRAAGELECASGSGGCRRFGMDLDVDMMSA